MFDNSRAWFLSIAILGSVNAYANQEVGSGTIQFDGVLLLEECVVDAQSAVQNIHIGDFASSIFTQRDSVSPAKGFSIVLKDCTAQIKGTQILFSGDTDNDNPDLLALRGGGTDTMATGIGIELLDESGAAIKLNQQTGQFSLKPGNNTLNFQLRYKSTLPQVTAGDASAVMYFDMVYQ
ncbi:fimbrial protein [Enterobacteriaceae bacterium G50]|nr:fimbrial protein [Enterobacteriaceae bacterium G50]